MSKPLRLQQGVSQVNQQQERDQQHDAGFKVHGLPHTLTEAHVSNRKRKKHNSESDVDQILHQEARVGHLGDSARCGRGNSIKRALRAGSQKSFSSAVGTAATDRDGEVISFWVRSKPL